MHTRPRHDKEKVLPRVIHFEFPADQPERAERFYSDVFGWKFAKWDGPTEYWMIDTGKEGPGINGGMMRRRPGAATTNTIGVDSVDETVRTVVANGGGIALPKMAIPGVGWLAYCTDPEGNVFGIMQSDPAAA
jgi:predicted enzyme related to lactoylglutathione lyase